MHIDMCLCLLDQYEMSCHQKTLPFANVYVDDKCKVCRKMVLCARLYLHMRIPM